VNCAPPPGGHLCFFWQEKINKYFFPTTTEQKITRVKIVHDNQWHLWGSAQSLPFVWIAFVREPFLTVAL
jgi:hypothetical protein